MTRVLTLKEYALEQYNRLLESEGSDVRVVWERPRPRVVASRDGNVLTLRKQERDDDAS